MITAGPLSSCLLFRMEVQIILFLTSFIPMPFPAVANPSPPPCSCLTPQKYFAAENAQLKLKFSPAGGRVGAQVKVAFSVFDAQTDQPAIVSPADVKATLEGPERLVVQTRGAANKYGVHLTAQTAGEYTVTATVRDKFTQKCTFRISAGARPFSSQELLRSSCSHPFPPPLPQDLLILPQQLTPRNAELKVPPRPRLARAPSRPFASTLRVILSPLTWPISSVVPCPALRSSSPSNSFPIPLHSPPSYLLRAHTAMWRARPMEMDRSPRPFRSSSLLSSRLRSRSTTSPWATPHSKSAHKYLRGTSLWTFCHNLRVKI